MTSDIVRPGRLYLRVFLKFLSVLVLLGVLIYFTPLGIFVIIPYHPYTAQRRSLREDAQRKDHDDALVRLLEPRIVTPGKEYRFTVGTDRDPQTLVEMKEPNAESTYENRIVRTCRDETDRRVVMFLTQDLGHPGNCWLYYFNPPAPRPRTFLSGEQVTPVAPGWFAVFDGRG
ncbi:MAG TPA: hypothetical protein VE981_03365 [Planctomycetota bacterium]|nr:hypothetical protein [Planctomycetota bacterium]